MILPYQLNDQPGAFDLYLREDGLVFKSGTAKLGVMEGMPLVELSAPPTTKP